jgi:anti-sigma factor RsiW
MNGGERGKALTCRELVELVTTYLEGELGSGGRTRFEAHVAHCSGCATYLRETRRMLRVLRNVGGEPAWLGGRAGLLGAFRAWRAGGPSGARTGAGR